MSFISWNCRGLGSPSTVPNLKYLVRTYKPDGIFLSETMAALNKIEELKYILSFDSCFTVDRICRGEGLAFLWKKSANCIITNYSQNHIDIEVVDPLCGKWRLTGFYGMPESGRRKESWNFLRNLARVSSLPWCVIRDYNDILSDAEKKGRSERAPWLICGFRQVVIDAGLIDLEMNGYEFTWFKSLGTDREVEEKLDRALVNSSWCNLFPATALECLTTTSSDQYPLLLNCKLSETVHRNPQRFKFENTWLAEPDFRDQVKARRQHYPHGKFTQKLTQCVTDLSEWSRNNNNNIRREISKVQGKIARF